MNHTVAKLDSHGFIDSSSFAKDLHSALDEDKKYKETDYMKKRAVKVAKSYDEFKDMVACAHLGTVSRKEVEELSEKKKGWKKTHTSYKGTSLLDEPDNGRNAANLTTSTLPKTMMEFGRDWRRLEGLDARLPYLIKLGTSKFKKISSGADDFELLEDIQMSLVQVHEEQCAGENSLKLDAGKWLKAMTSIKQYDMLMGCVKAELRARVEAILSQREVDKANEKERLASSTFAPAAPETTEEPVTVFESITALKEVVYDANDELD
jgi:hypothetical protein